jgi:hypothetical protein
MKTSMRSVMFCAGLCFATLCSHAKADSFTYTEVATASGKFAGSAFTNATVTLTATGDPSLASDIGGIYSMVIPVTVTVDGLGSGTLTQKIEIVSNNGVPEVGFGDLTDNLAILFDENDLFANFNLATGIGPVSGTALFNSGQAFKTSNGNLKLDDVSTVSFTAADDSIAPMPEPSCLAMVATGALWLAGMARKQR